MRVFVCGHNGLVGSAILRALERTDDGYKAITASRRSLDLTDQQAVVNFFEDEKPDTVILCAAKVGGIVANNFEPVDFLSINLKIQSNVIEAAHGSNVNNLIFLGSSCIYPKEASIPIREQDLLAGPLEKTNEAYAIAKIAGLKLCEAFRTQYGRDYRAVMPTNLYGLNDYYHETGAHVIPSLIAKFHDAKVKNLPELRLLGNGRAMREFLFADDLAVFLLKLLKLNRSVWEENVNIPLGCNHLNVGSGEEISIKILADKISQVVGYSGLINFDSDYLTGTYRKLLDSGVARNFGLRSEISLDEGLQLAYGDFLARKANSTLRF